MAEHTRTLDFRVAFAMGLGTMIAAGIFSLSGKAVAAVGSTAVLSFVIAAVVAGLTAASYSEFASIYSENGGGYLFVSRTFEGRDLLVYAVGASLFLGYTGTTAFYLATMDEWFFKFILPGGLPLPRGSVGIVAAVLLGALNARGTEESGTFQVLVTGAKVAVLLAFIGGAFAYKAPADTVGTFTANVTTQPVPILTMASLAFITFFGFSAIAASAGEIIKPRETVPKAIAASIVTVTVLYALVIVAMVNSPVPAQVVAELGEVAMGRVAAAFLGPIGRSLIVAGAVFSMVSASNASVLAASGIGSLMGRQGQAPRRFSRIHQRYGTPFWSIATATGVIVVLIAVFQTLFGHHGLIHGVLTLGLNPLTGFATLNLLLPLSVVNVALIVSRRAKPDIDRPLTVPFVPVVPLIGVAANLLLIVTLPPVGAALGFALVAAVVMGYLAWGGAPHVDEIVEEVVESRPSTGQPGGSVPDDRFHVLVPVARPHRAPRYVRLAETLARASHEKVHVQVLTVTQIPDQTPNEMMRDTAADRADHLVGILDEADLDAEYSVEGHTCRDLAFDILHTAREDGADAVVMGYPDRHPDVAATVEREAPCDVFFAANLPEEPDFSTVTVGVGGGPHHRSLLPLIRGLGEAGAALNLVRVVPTGGTGTDEPLGETRQALAGVGTLTVNEVAADTIAEGLVQSAREAGGVLMVGASRTERLRQWVFGSTPDRVVDAATEQDVPVLVYAAPLGLTTRLSDFAFLVVRYAERLVARRRGQAPESEDGETVAD